MTYPQGELRNRLDRRSSKPKSGPSLPPLCVVRTLPTIPLTQPYHCSMMKGVLRNISPGSFCSPIYSWTRTSSVQTNKQTWSNRISLKGTSYLLAAGKRSELAFQVVDWGQLCELLFLQVSRVIYRRFSTTSHTWAQSALPRHCPGRP